MKEFLKLVDVKSMVTLSITAVFSYLAIVGSINPEQFMIIFAMIMTFYFTKKDETK